jgi:DNA-binding transcriptional ArsR family regulator
MAHNIDNVFSALADSSRRQILAMLSEKDMNVNSIAGKFKVSRPAISKHLRVLTRSKLVKPKQMGQILFNRNTGRVNWLNFRKFWNEKLDLLKTFVEKNK